MTSIKSAKDVAELVAELLGEIPRGLDGSKYLFSQNVRSS